MKLLVVLYIVQLVEDTLILYVGLLDMIGLTFVVYVFISYTQSYNIILSVDFQCTCICVYSIIIGNLSSILLFE